MLIKGRNSKLAPAIGLALCITALAQAGESPRHNAVVEAVSRVMPGVVNIITKTRVQRVRYYYDWWRDNWAPYAQELPPQESAGSGVVVDASGYVLTNVHVVKDAGEIWVKINDKNGAARIYQAEAIAGSLATDIALLKIIPEEPGETFAAATFASDDDLLLGETVLALGNPFGLGGSVSRGILSSKSRRTETEGSKLDIPDWLQTDASINQGNSGGPLISMAGEVIGINTAIFSPTGASVGLGFAIPSNLARPIVEQLIEFGRVRRGWLGVRIQRVTPEIAEQFAMDADTFADKVVEQIRAGEFYVVTHSYNMVRIKPIHDEIADAYARNAPRYDGDEEYDVPTLIARLRSRRDGA